MPQILEIDTPRPPIHVVLKDLGHRVERYRIARGLRQKDLADMAGISRRTLTNLEGGAGTTLETMLRILRALSIEDRFLDLVPDAVINPLDPMSAHGTERQRVRPRAGSDNQVPFRWGDTDTTQNSSAGPPDEKPVTSPSMSAGTSADAEPDRSDEDAAWLASRPWAGPEPRSKDDTSGSPRVRDRDTSE